MSPMPCLISTFYTFVDWSVPYLSWGMSNMPSCKYHVYDVKYQMPNLKCVLRRDEVVGLGYQSQLCFGIPGTEILNPMQKSIQ